MIGPKKKLILQKKKSTSDNMGGFEETWNYIKTMKGYLSTVSGRTRTLADKSTIDVTHIYYVDYPKDEIIPDSLDYRFTDDDENEYIIAYCNNPGTLNKHLEIELRLLT